jgi:signal transduction histidine kinase
MLAMLALLVAGAFALVVFGLGRVPSDQQVALLVATAAASVLSAMLWVPLRARSEPVARRLVRRERGAPEEALRVFGTRLSLALPLDELLLQLAETLRRTLRLETAEVWIASDSLLERAASDPPAAGSNVVLTDGEHRVLVRAGVCGAAWAAVWLPVLVEGRAHAELRVAPIVNADELLGLIVVQRHGAAQPFDEEDERVLGELARQAGLAFRNLRLDSALQASLDELRVQAEELRASRSRVVAAADAERRRIERDIHDGAQQQLIALAVNLRVARELAQQDPAASRELLRQLGGDVRDTLEDVRALARGIYPPLLLDSGLAPALRAAAARAAIDVRIEIGTLGRHPADVEASVYFCCLEALQNAAKHAGGAACATLRVSAGSGLVRFEVADDGVGFDPASPSDHGVGLQGMADRLGAVGGALTVASCPGRGTRISGSVPSR